MTVSESGARHDPKATLSVMPSWPVQEDLHLHTSASDGVKNPSEMVEFVSTTSLRLFSITDHDTTSGLDEAESATLNYPDIILIPGIELSAEVSNNEIHLTCHFIDRNHQGLQVALADLVQDRETKAEQIVERLKDIGLPVAWHDVTAGADGAIGRPHIARAMLAYGYVDSIVDAFQRYLSPGRPAYVSRRKLTGVHALELVHNAGGVATLAHPRTARNINEVLSILAPQGLAGIEVYAEKYDSNMIDKYSTIAHRFGLIKSGGSDYHANGTVNEILPGMNGPQPGTVRELYQRAIDMHQSDIGFSVDESKL